MAHLPQQRTGCCFNPNLGLQALPTLDALVDIVPNTVVSIPTSGYRLFRRTSIQQDGLYCPHVSIPTSGYRLFRLRMHLVQRVQFLWFQSQPRATGSSDTPFLSLNGLGLLFQSQPRATGSSDGLVAARTASLAAS